MKTKIKTEIENINKGCKEQIEKYDLILKCGDWLPSDFDRIKVLCPSCRKYKQGLIQGAKMVIEDEIKFLIELSKFMTAGDEESIRRLEVNTNWCMVLERLKELQDTELKLNNWLEKICN